MGQLKRVVAASFAAMLSTFGIAVATAAPAQAAYSCTSWETPQGWIYGKCLNGEPNGNYYRVHIVCANWFGTGSYVKNGTIVNVNDSIPSSITGCGAFERYYGSPWTETMWNYHP